MIRVALVFATLALTGCIPCCGPYGHGWHGGHDGAGYWRGGR